MRGKVGLGEFVQGMDFTLWQWLGDVTLGDVGRVSARYCMFR